MTTVSPPTFTHHVGLESLLTVVAILVVLAWLLIAVNGIVTVGGDTPVPSPRAQVAPRPGG